MGFEFLPLPDLGIARAAGVLTRAFSDYFVKIPFTAAGLLQLARTDSVDLAASLVVVRAGEPLGVGLIARRGWTCRLAGMAVVPEARRLGAGQGLVQRLLEEAQRRGERAMTLEVIEQNGPAVNLYEACGFTRRRRLVGFSRRDGVDPSPAPAAPPVAADLRAMAAVLMSEGLPDLPWQLAGETIAMLGPPAVAYRLDGSWVALSNLSGAQVAIRALVTERPAQGRGRGAALLRSVMARHPGKEWQMKAIWPEELGRVFVAAGFAPTELTQWQMTRELI